MLRLHHQHTWDLTPREAMALQERLRACVIQERKLETPAYVAGVDVGFEDRNRITRAAVAVLSFPALELVEQSVVRRPTTFPYVPGLLSFRELPAVLAALQDLRQLPQLLLCDGQGIAHPRRFGIAAHLGVLTDIPSIGVAKTRLIGEYRDPPQRRGAWTPLRDHDEVIGAALRSRVQTRPLFISIGHRVDLEAAVHYVMACTSRYRLPETTRRAHRLASGN